MGEERLLEVGAVVKRCIEPIGREAESESGCPTSALRMNHKNSSSILRALRPQIWQEVTVFGTVTCNETLPKSLR